MVAFKKLPWVAVDPLDWAVCQFLHQKHRMGHTITILDTSHLQHLFGSGGGNNTGTSGCTSVLVDFTITRLAA